MKFCDKCATTTKKASYCDKCATQYFIKKAVANVKFA